MADSLLGKVQTWWGNVPCVTRFVAFLLPVITALCIVFSLDLYLANNVYATVYCLQGAPHAVYRLLTTAVITVGPIDV